MKKVLLLSLTIVATFAIFTSCNLSTQNREMVKKENYGVYQGKDVFLFTLTNKAGNVLKLSNFGARIVWTEVPDRNGKKDNVAFGFDTFDAMIKGDPYFGAVVGRYANRIANAKFTLDGTEYTLAKNDGQNSLHGGPGGWHSVVWNAEVPEKKEFPAVKFTYISPDMEEGYPGTVNVEATYTWTDKNEIVIEYKCTTDKKTVINITNHCYFNLHGAGNGDILDHQLTINASKFSPVDAGLIPTGGVHPVAGTPFDFTTAHTVGERINETCDQLTLGKGYDHNFILDNTQKVAATVYDPSTGRMLEVITDQPGVQFYCGNFLNGTLIGHGGKPYIYRSGLCLETQHFPDSPNQSGFPSTVLSPGKPFTSKTIYRFSVK